MTITRSEPSINLSELPNVPITAQQARVAYLSGRSLAQAYQRGDVSADYVQGATHGMSITSVPMWRHWLAGYRDGIDHYDINRTGREWDDIARRWYEFARILPGQ